MRSLAILLGGLALAACRVPIPEAQNESTYEDGAVFNIVNAVAPVDAGNAYAVEEKGSTLPPAFQGRWGLVPNDCTSRNGDAKGLMIVENDRLTFYESRASVAEVTPISSTELKVALSFTGEGQEWTDNTPLILEDNGNALTRVADGQTLRYTRCGA